LLQTDSILQIRSATI